MNFLFCYADSKMEWNCSQFLAIDPMNAINKRGDHTAKAMHISEFIQNSPETQEIIKNSDLVLLERNAFQDALTLLQFYKVRNMSNFAIMFDDGYSVIHPKNVSYGFWHDGKVSYKDEQGNDQASYLKPPPLTQLGWAIASSKGLQCVSQALIDDWKHCNDGYLINHHIVPEKYEGKDKPLYPHTGTIVGWGGSMSHMDSFESSGLLRAFTKIVSKYKDVKIMITGDRRVYDLVNVPPNKKIFSPFVPAEQYPGLIKSFDIFTIPMANAYDLRRSQIKPTEAAYLGIPFLASDVPNYSHIKPYGNFTKNGWQNWVEKLSEMIENLPKYKQKAMEEDIKWGQSQVIDLHIDERIDLYKKLIEKPYRFSYPPDERELRRGNVQ